MKPAIAPVTQGLPAALAAASIGLSLFMLPGGGGSVRPLPVVPAMHLAGQIAASVGQGAGAPFAPAPVHRPTVAHVAAPHVVTSTGRLRQAARPPVTRTPARPPVARHPVAAPPPAAPETQPSAPTTVAPAALSSPPSSHAHGRGKPMPRSPTGTAAHTPPGLSGSHGHGPAGGHGRSEEHPHGPQTAPPGRAPGGGNGEDHGEHGGGDHGGGGR